MTNERLVSLLPDQAELLDRLFASGEFESERDVVGQALQLLRERVDVNERWLVDDVVPVIDAMRAYPDRALSLDQVDQALQDHHKKASAASRRA